MPKTIRQSVTIKAPAHDVYEALIDSKKHARFSGESASISRKEGGSFSAYSGYATGTNLRLVKDKEIVQSWRGSDWKDDEVSEVTYTFTRIKGGTRLTFTQRGVPDRFYASIKQGWIDFYWKPMKEMLETD